MRMIEDKLDELEGLTLTSASIVSGTSSGEDARAQFKSAATALGTAYREAYGPIDCE
jgi:hypothetical protein